MSRSSTGKQISSADFVITVSPSGYQTPPLPPGGVWLQQLSCCSIAAFIKDEPSGQALPALKQTNSNQPFAAVASLSLSFTNRAVAATSATSEAS
jgi:hypothetical protein